MNHSRDVFLFHNFVTDNEAAEIKSFGVSVISHLIVVFGSGVSWVLLRYLLSRLIKYTIKLLFPGRRYNALQLEEQQTKSTQTCESEKRE